MPAGYPLDQRREYSEKAGEKCCLFFGTRIRCSAKEVLDDWPVCGHLPNRSSQVPQEYWENS